MDIAMSDRHELVSAIPLFSGLSAEQRTSIERLFFHVRREDGDNIVTEGDDGAVNFYVITDGEAVVSVHGKEVGRLGPGDYFGEAALIKSRPRAATVTAAGTLEMLAVSGWNLAQLLEVDTAIRDAIEQAVAARSTAGGAGAARRNQTRRADVPRQIVSHRRLTRGVTTGALVALLAAIPQAAGAVTQTKFVSAAAAWRSGTLRCGCRLTSAGPRDPPWFSAARRAPLSAASARRCRPHARGVPRP
jgi:CRP-like cAMP-binding protein